MTRLIAIALTLLLVTAGGSPVAVAATPTANPSTAGEPIAESVSASAVSAQTADGSVGCVDGVCHDDELAFEEPTNLSKAELDALVDRTMARVEELRGEPFTEDVTVEVQSREAFREDNVVSATTDNEQFNRWNDQVWEALFVVGKDRRSADAIDATVGASVNGFYLPSEDRIVIVTSSPDSPTVNERTLLHEFVHALQDQRYDFTASQYNGETQDANLAVDGVIEGEAVYLEYLYEDRCQSGAWECFDDPITGGASGGAPSNQGLLYLLLQPYSDGPVYVDEIRAEEGWAGVDDRIADPPSTTTEIIHRRSVEPRRLAVDDEATAGWERYPNQGRNGAEVAGEASIYVMFWYQAREYGADTIDPTAFGRTPHEYDRYDYVAAPSEGWVADELYPYRRGDDDGYVWTTQWESPHDATEFRRAYGEILAAHDASQTESGTYVVSNGSFSGAYAVDADGQRITIVHAPTTEGLFELRPSLDPDATDAGPTIADAVPGFGIVITLVGLAVAAAVGRRQT